MKLSVKTKMIIIALSTILPGVLLSLLGFQAASKQRFALTQTIRESWRNTAKNIIDRVERDTTYRSMEIADNALSDAIDGDVSEKLRGYAEREEFVDVFFYMDKESRLVFPQEMLQPEKTIAEIESSYSDSSFCMAEVCEFVKGDIPKAAELYEKNLKDNLTDSQRTAVINAAARCYLKLARYDDAISKYRRLLETGRMVLIAQYQIGLCDKLQGKNRKATETFLSLYNGLIKCQWRVASEQNEYFKSKARNEITEILKDGSFPSLKEQFDSLKKLEETLAKEMAFLTVLKGSIIPKFYAVGRAASPLMNEPAVRSTEGTPASVGVFKSLFEEHNGEPYLVHTHSLKDGGVLGFRVSLPYVKEQITTKVFRENKQDVLIIDNDGEIIYPEEQQSEGEYLVEERFSEFPEWRVAIPKSRITNVEKQAARQIHIYIGLIVLAIIALIAGIFLTVRNVSRELEIARMKSDFVSNVSHELKTPLSLIRLFGETLEMERVTSDEKRREYYQIITKESERLTHLINNVLSFSRIEAGKKRYEFEHADIAEVVKRTVDAYRFHIERAGFQLEVDIAEELPEIRVDSDAISQALLNLLSNAVKYSDEQKHITVRAVMRGDEIVVEIEDKGVGIKKEEQKRIFDKFYRGNTVRQSGGSGLGLTLVKHIIEAHNGRVEVESEEGKGSKFSLIIPVGEFEL